VSSDNPTTTAANGIIAASAATWQPWCVNRGMAAMAAGRLCATGAGTIDRMADDDGTEAVRSVFEQAGCEGSVCVQALDDGAEFALHADEPAISASVVKVQIALEAESWFAEGRLDPCELVTLAAADRTPGPTGVSLFEDDAVLSWRDMVVLMLTISDNDTTDALLRRIGVDAVNVTAARLQLGATVLESELRVMLDTIGRDLGHVDWQDLVAWMPQASEEEMARADERLPATTALNPATGTRTSARDMVRLLRLIWTDQAGPAAACERVRAVMGRQLTRHRLASAFRPPVRVAAKSGSLLGVVRNEVGVISYPDGRRYAAAVFTRSRPGANDAAINAAIGTAAARAIASLRA
jgi:beta-lactamase class A